MILEVTSAMLLSALMESFLLDLRRAGRSPRTEDYYASKFKALRMSLEGEVSNLSRDRVLAFMDRRSRTGTATSLALELRALGTVLRHGRRIGLAIPFDIASVPLPRPRRQPRTRFLTADQVEALNARLPAAVGAWVAFAVATGARLSEANMAELGDIDLEKGTVLIRGTKTEGSARIIPVLPFAKPLLQRCLARSMGPRLLVPFTAHSWFQLRTACQELGIPPVSPNDLRRTCATWLVQAGVPLNLVAFVLGHRDTKMVERVYGRMTTSAASQLIAASYRRAS